MATIAWDPWAFDFAQRGGDKFLRGAFCSFGFFLPPSVSLSTNPTNLYYPDARLAANGGNFAFLGGEFDNSKTSTLFLLDLHGGMAVPGRTGGSLVLLIKVSLFLSTNSCSFQHIGRQPLALLHPPPSRPWQKGGLLHSSITHEESWGSFGRHTNLFTPITFSSLTPHQGSILFYHMYLFLPW